MKKKIVTMFVAMILLLSVGVISHAASFEPTINATNGSIGDTISVDVSIPAGTSAVGGSFNLVYDNTKMELVDAAAGSLITDRTNNVNKAYAANKIRVNFAGTTNISSEGGIALTATFKLTAEGDALIATEKFKLMDIDTNSLSCSDASKEIKIGNIPTNKIKPTINATNGSVGDTISVDVSIPAGTSAVGGSFNLVYDNTKMELVDAAAGSLIIDRTNNVNKAYAMNKIRVNFAGTTNISASGGKALTATFKLMSEGEASLSTEKFKLMDIDTVSLDCEDERISFVIGDPIPGTVAQPAASVSSGTVEKGAQITLTTETAGADIYYTTDGSTPTTASTKYIDTIVIDDNITIKAIAVKEGMNDSDVAIFVYSVLNGENTTITVSNAMARAGATVSVMVDLENKTNIAGMTLKLSYDEQLTLTAITKGSGLDSLTFTPPKDVSLNPCNLLWDGINGDSTSGNILTLEFKVNDDASVGDYNVELSYNNGDVYDDDLNDITVDIVNGRITVVDYKLGDVNDDGLRNAKDITLLRRFISGSYGVTIIEAAADVNKDGSINAKDITILRRFIQGSYGITLE